MRLPSSPYAILPRAGEPILVRVAAAVVVQRVKSCLTAGFPSPADDYVTKAIDLNQVLIRHPQATFLFKIRGSSMRDAGIDDGNVVLVDRALPALHGRIVVAIVDGEFTCKHLWKRGGVVKLQAANPEFEDITPREGQIVEVWGVVTDTIKSMLD